MRAVLILLILSLSFSGCGDATDDKPKELTFEGDNGLSFDKAVSIANAEDKAAAYKAMNKWIVEKFPNCSSARRYPHSADGRDYQLIEMFNPDGTKFYVYFDITDMPQY